jgi:hypothetical protein
LDFKVEGNIKYDGNVFQTNNYASYKRSYIPQTNAEAHAKLLLSERSLELEVTDVTNKRHSLTLSL